jgi:hypothetical protein
LHLVPWRSLHCAATRRIVILPIVVMWALAASLSSS